MKFFKWKIWFITSVTCVAPMILGIAMWNKLPSSMAIHFDINNQPDGFASRGFAVFGMPLLMVLLQMICCVINDINAAKHGVRKKFERITKWIIPVMSMILYLVTIWVNLGEQLNIRVIVVLIVGIIQILIGNYMPKLDYIKDYDLDTEKARRINRFTGFTTVIMGILMITSIFLPPTASVIALFLLIPYAIINIIYGIYVGRK